MNQLSFLKILLVAFNILFQFAYAESFSKNKIVCLVSPPRSLSTAFLRMMESRGDFEVMLEPSLHIGKTMRKKDLEQFIFKKAENSHVFIKELSLNSSFLKDNIDFIKRDNVYFIFLLRNPHDQLISQYKKMIADKEVVVRQPVHERTYMVLNEMYDSVKKFSKNKPCILLAEDLSEKSNDVYKFLCDFLTIPYKENALSWQSLGEDFNAESWNALKSVEKAQLWQGDAIMSSGFHPLTKYKLDSQGNPSFEEVAEQHKKTCHFVYSRCLSLYTKILRDNAQNVFRPS